MRNLQNLSADLDENLLVRYRKEAETLAESILDSDSVQEDAEECCLALLACRAALQMQKQQAERKQKSYQKELDALSDSISSFRKESAQLKQEVSRYQSEIGSLRIHLQDRSFRMLQLYMQNAQQEEELAELRGIPSPLTASKSMLSLQLQLKELASQKKILLDQLSQLEQQRTALHQKIRKLKEEIVSGSLPVQKHRFAVLSMQIFQDTLDRIEQQIVQVQEKISAFDLQQEELSKKIESAFAKNGDELS